MVVDNKRMESLIGHIVNDPPHESLRKLNRNLDIIDDDISIDCTTLTNYCVCAANFEYFRKPEHVIQCLRKQKCFHCQRYRCMDKKFETVTATTKLLLITAALGKFELFRFLHRQGCCLETKSGIFELRPLHLAIVNGHFNIFCYLLAQQVDINATILSHGTSYSPLMLAVMHGQENIVHQLLMCRGINLTYRNSMLQSPVSCAVQNNNIELVNILLSAEDMIHDKRINAHKKRMRNLHHPCAMLEALKKDNAKVLKALLDNGCQANFVFNGYHAHTTALVLAAVSNSSECLELLVDHGADIDHKVNGYTALDWATHLNWTECINVLQSAKFKSLLFSLEDTATTDALSVNFEQLVEDEHIGNIEESSETDDIESEETITQRGVPSQPVAPLISIWSFVQWIDVSKPIRRLVQQDHEINACDMYNRTSLHVAVEDQNVTGVRTLIQLGADAERSDVCGATPLWHAVYWNKESMVKELIFANVQMESKAREDAFKIGLTWVDVPVPEHSGQDYRSTLYICVRKNFAHTVRLFLEAGYRLNDEDVGELVAIAKPAVKDMLLDYSSQPSSLFNTARNYIRRHCGRNIHKLVEDTDLPIRIKDCLLLRDLIDLKIEPDFT